MNILNIKIVPAYQMIPHILHGISANTMFILINNDIDTKNNYYGNTASMDLPYDLDDFSRCVNAANIFKWTNEDLKKAVQRAEHIGLSKMFINFYKEFLIYKTKFESGNEKEVRDWIDFIRNKS